MIWTPFQKEQIAAYFYYLKKQSRLNHNDDLVLSGISARDASEKRVSHRTRTLHCFLQPRLLPDRTGSNPASTKNTLGVLKKKKS